MLESSIHTKSGLTDVEKFQHLKGQLMGDALELMAGFRMTSDNYAAAVEMLHAS